MEKKSIDRVLDMILSQLEKISENQEKLSEEIQKTNIEMTKVSGLKHAVSDLKKWKEGIDEVVNVDDFGKIKEFYLEHQNIEADVTDLYLITSEIRKDTDDYKKFKTKTMTIIGVIAFLFTTLLTLLGVFAKWRS